MSLKLKISKEQRKLKSEIKSEREDEKRAMYMEDDQDLANMKHKHSENYQKTVLASETKINQMMNQLEVINNRQNA